MFPGSLLIKVFTQRSALSFAFVLFCVPVFVHGVKLGIVYLQPEVLIYAYLCLSQTIYVHISRHLLSSCPSHLLGKFACCYWKKPYQLDIYRTYLSFSCHTRYGTSKFLFQNIFKSQYSQLVCHILKILSYMDVDKLMDGWVGISGWCELWSTLGKPHSKKKHDLIWTLPGQDAGSCRKVSRGVIKNLTLHRMEKNEFMFLKR